MLLEPYKAMQRVTVAEWLSKVIMLSGQKGIRGFVQSGSSSHVIMRGVDMAMVIEAGDWANVSTFKIIIINKGCYLLQGKFCHEDDKWITGMALLFLLEAKNTGVEQGDIDNERSTLGMAIGLMHPYFKALL